MLLAKQVLMNSAEVMFMIRISNYSLLEHRRNEDILKELKVGSFVSYLHQYRHRGKSTLRG